MTAETQIQQLARISGLVEATVAAALGGPPAPRPLRNDAELDDAYRRVRSGARLGAVGVSVTRESTAAPGSPGAAPGLAR